MANRDLVGAWTCKRFVHRRKSVVGWIRVGDHAIRAGDEAKLSSSCRAVTSRSGGPRPGSEEQAREREILSLRANRSRRFKDAIRRGGGGGGPPPPRRGGRGAHARREDSSCAPSGTVLVVGRIVLVAQRALTRDSALPLAARRSASRRSSTRSCSSIAAESSHRAAPSSHRSSRAEPRSSESCSRSSPTSAHTDPPE